MRTFRVASVSKFMMASSLRADLKYCDLVRWSCADLDVPLWKAVQSSVNKLQLCVL
jgi:hypothetical protein